MWLGDPTVTDFNHNLKHIIILSNYLRDSVDIYSFPSSVGNTFVSEWR
jgi:hypothetical protein